MAQIVRTASAGSAVSGDVLVTVTPAQGLSVEIHSALLRRFGEAIRQSVLDVLAQYEIENAAVILEDCGALDWILRARVETALLRGKEGV